MFLYSVSFYAGEENLFYSEMKHLFGEVQVDKFLLSEKKLDVNKSPFIRTSLEISLSCSSLEDMVDEIKSKKISYDNFKVKYIDTDDKMEFNEKHRIEGVIGYVINGEAKLREPDITLGVTRLNGKWILGEYKRNADIWQLHKKRPFQYSNALPTKISRALVNIASVGLCNCRLVDPCCGVGTVVMEGLSMGLNIKGFDINPNIVVNARENLKFFNYPDVIETKDIHDIGEHYDAAIIDIPYGLLSATTKEIQRGIIESSRNICDKLVLITLDEMVDDIRDAGYEIVEKFDVSKRDFKRYVSICR